MRKEDRRIPKNLIPKTVFVGLLSDWYYGWDGWAGEPIEEFGLQSGKEGQFRHSQDGKRKDSIYVSAYLGLAKTYARLNPRPMVLAIDVDQLDKEKFYHDPLDVDVGRSGKPIQMAYRGNIPIEAIKIGWEKKEEQ